jgi:BlaI family transcriptional regulator, penicillinase repressor
MPMEEAHMKLTQAEWQLMNALWEKHPATAREIAERLPEETKWAYTTTKTMLTRLAAKGAVSETLHGKSAVYSPLVTRQKARLAALRSVAEEAFDGAFGSLVHFLLQEEKISPEERKKLAKMLDEESKKGGGK